MNYEQIIAEQQRIAREQNYDNFEGSDLDPRSFNKGNNSNASGEYTPPKLASYMLSAKISNPAVGQAGSIDPNVTPFVMLDVFAPLSAQHPIVTLKSDGKLGYERLVEKMDKETVILDSVHVWFSSEKEVTQKWEVFLNGNEGASSVDIFPKSFKRATDYINTERISIPYDRSGQVRGGVFFVPVTKETIVRIPVAVPAQGTTTDISFAFDAFYKFDQAKLAKGESPVYSRA